MTLSPESASDPAAERGAELARQRLVRRGVRLEYLTVGWNLVEAAVAVAVGAAAGSIALLGFGIDSAIETASGAVLLWRLRADQEEERRERIEGRAVRLVGATLLALAVYVTAESVKTLIGREAPHVSYAGIAIAAVSLLVMPALARAKRRVAAAIGSRALDADSRETEICAWLSAILLVGLVLNAWRGWWWSDPVAGLLMAPLIAREGFEAIRGDQSRSSAA